MEAMPRTVTRNTGFFWGLRVSSQGGFHTCCCGSHVLVPALSQRMAPGPPGVGWSPLRTSPPERAVDAAGHISCQDPGVLPVQLSNHVPRRQEARCCMGRHSHPTEEKLRLSSEYFASVFWGKGAQLGLTSKPIALLTCCLSGRAKQTERGQEGMRTALLDAPATGRGRTLGVTEMLPRHPCAPPGLLSPS